MFAGGPVEAKKGVMELVAAQAGKKLPSAATDPKFAWLWRLAPYAIGGLASFWLVERVAAF